MTEVNLNAYIVPVHTPIAANKRHLHGGRSDVVSQQTVVAIDVDHARSLAEDIVRRFAGLPGMQVMSFRSEVTKIVAPVVGGVEHGRD